MANKIKDLNTFLVLAHKLVHRKCAKTPDRPPVPQSLLPFFTPVACFLSGDAIVIKIKEL
ncbi:hypothetical protein ACO0LO_22130 [Undibacterium sp. TJN25]|uniref:hypothetical protein n=1 Tax=Undibacterium sp. TJN25 TaxID=3413056 RepID=UPI003BF009AF